MKTTQTQTKTNNTATTTQTLEPQNTTTATQTPDRSKDTAEICVSRVDPNICVQEERTHNVEPPAMGPAAQLEASHEMITDELVATVKKATNTVESEEDTPLFRQRLQRVLGVHRRSHQERSKSASLN